MGDRPTSLDATVYGHVGNFIQPPYQHPIVTFARQQTNLCAHYERMTSRFFSELIADRPASYVSQPDWIATTPDRLRAGDPA